MSVDDLDLELPGARVVFTTRRGGFSTGSYASLNLGRFTDDDAEVVERNCELLAGRLGVEFSYGRQVHGARVRRVVSRASASEVGDADGQATTVAGVAPMVLTADCLPIAVVGKGAVAMLHAGWRGLAAGVVAEGVRAVRGLGAREPLHAAIGPGAGPCCYEVGAEVHAVFAEEFGASVRRGNNLDLKAIARAQLAQAGVGDVHDVGFCTICCDPQLFYSHRRDGGLTGRQAGIAWLT